MVVITFLLSCSISLAQNKKTETVKVYGNCGMCKKNIEKAATIKGVSSTKWDPDSSMLTMTYDSRKTSGDEILKNVASVGYDSASHKATDEAYNALHGCCKYERPNGNTLGTSGDTHQNHDIAMTSTTASSEGNTQGNILQAVYSGYFAVKDALVKSDGKTAAAKASELFQAINKVPMDKMTPEQHTIWMKVLNEMKEDAEHISDTQDVPHQRDHFETLSTNMYNVLKVFKTDEKVYYQNCPMYNKGKGAKWLSTDKAVKNPYYGSQMLTCGSTLETIK